MAKYTFKLSEESIKKALSIVREYQMDFNAKQDMFLERLAERGAEIAKEELETLVYSNPSVFQTRELINSIKYGYDPKTKRGWVGTDLFYAKFVEFGTGPRGAAKSHPDATESWSYRSTPWFYYNDRVGKVLRTAGFESRPFMYNTARRMESEAVKIAREVFGS